MRDQLEIRRAIVAPVVETINDGADMWDDFADAARERGDLQEEEYYRASARRSRERAVALAETAG